MLQHWHGRRRQKDLPQDPISSLSVSQSDVMFCSRSVGFGKSRAPLDVSAVTGKGKAVRNIRRR